jgi:hypothetical protein
VRATLHRRLKQLEQVRAADLEAERYLKQEEEGRSVVEEIREALRISGFEPGPDESLASATARFLGISYDELRSQLAERVCER